MTKTGSILLLFLIFLSSFPALGESLHNIVIEEGDADTTIRQFSLQARVNLIYTPDDVEGVTTNRVEGRFTPRKALELLLMNTPVTFNEDARTGAFAIIRTHDSMFGQTDDADAIPDETKASHPDGRTSIIRKIADNILGTAGTGSRTVRISNGEEIFELSPFEVDASIDMGYVAASTLSGSRLNTRLADTAASVSVFTEEFLNDTGLSDVQELTRYSLGSVNHTQDTAANPNINNFISGENTLQRIRVRGIRATKGINYFESLIPDDAYRSERYDESRGPNGILFGISNAGGIINTTTIKANTYRDSGRMRYSTGSYSQNRLEGRLNRVVLQDELAITIAGLTQDNGGWRDFQNDKRESLYGAVIWKPTDYLTIQALGETGNHHRVTLRPFNATDEFLAWYRNRELLGIEAVSGRPGLDGNNPNTALQALGVTGTLTNRNNTRYIYVANDQTFFNGAGTWISGSYDDMDVAPSPGSLIRSGIEADFPAKILNPEDFPYPHHLNAGGPDMFRDTDFETYTILADFKITKDLFLNFAHSFQETVIDAQYIAGSEPRLRGDPNIIQRHPERDAINAGALNPHVGELYFDANWRRDDHFADSRETRLSLSYDFDARDVGFDLLGRHRFGAGVSRRNTSGMLLQKFWAFLENPFHNRNFDNVNNRIAIRNYIREGDFSTYLAVAPPADQGVLVDDEGITRRTGWVHGTRGTPNSQADQAIDSLIAVLQSYFWNDKLVSIVGYRQDRARQTTYGYIIDPVFGDTISTDPAADGYRENNPISTSSKTVGFVFHALPNISLLSNYATSIGLPDFNNTVLPDATVAPPVYGEGIDAGISFNLLDNRVSGRLVYYETNEENQTGSGGITRILRDPNIFSMEALEQVFGTLRKPDGTPYSESEWKQEFEELAPDFNAVMQDNYSHGWEFSLITNITDNWRLVLNASKTDRITSNYGREAIKWLGWRKDQSGRLINGISFIDDGTANGQWRVDRSAYVPGSTVDRILEIAENAIGWDAGTLITDNNNESIAEALFLQMEELQKDIDEREKRWGLSPYKFNVFTAYDFHGDPFSGFTLGGGFRWLSGEIIGEDPDGNEFKSPSEGYFDLMLRYHHKLKKFRGSIDYQLNVYNLFDRRDVIPVRYSILTDESSPLSRFRLVEPLTVRASITYSF